MIPNQIKPIAAEVSDADDIRMSYCETCKEVHAFGYDDIGCQVEMLNCVEAERVTYEEFNRPPPTKGT